jgi:hypothetical protein
MAEYHERERVLAALREVYHEPDALEIADQVEASWWDCEETDRATTIRQAFEELAGEVVRLQAELARMRADMSERQVHLDNGRVIQCGVCGEKATGVCAHMAFGNGGES